MILYYIPILLCFISVIFRELSDNDRWYWFMGVILCIFYCFGYMTGTDWRVYEDLYNTLDFNHLFYEYKSEPGYYLYMLPFRFLGIGFWPFFIFTKSMLFVLIYRTMFEYCRDSKYLSLMYFFPWFGMYLFIDNPMRNLIAIGIFIISFRYVIEKNFWKFFFLMLLAASFHFSAFIIIFSYPILTRNIKTWIYVVSFILINILFIDREFLVSIITSVFGMIPYLQNKIITYILLDSVFAQGKALSVGMLWQTMLFVLLLVYRERIIKQFNNDSGIFVYNASMCFLLLMRFAMSIEMFVRLQLYFSVFFSIAVGLVILSFNYKSRLLFVSLLFLMSVYVCTEKITKSSRYVPYSNCIEYALIGDYPSYSKRFMYNIKNSPYTNEIDFEQ